MPDKVLNKYTKKAQKPLSKNAQKYLRGIAHDIKPVVTVADKGLSYVPTVKPDNNTLRKSSLKPALRKYNLSAKP